MLEIAIGLAVVLVVIVAPPLRRVAVSLLGLLAIIAVGVAAFAALVWALYESKPFVIAEWLAPVQEAPAPAQSDRDPMETAAADLTSALASEEAQQLKDEQLRLEEERNRISNLVARARVILEQDRKLAEQAASFPLPVGVGGGLGDIIAVRIPAWRDGEVAAQQSESIRTWLQSIGLGAEETVSIVTAKAWGSLYDMWVAENPHTAPASPPNVEPEAAPIPSEPEPSLPSQIAQEPPPIVPQARPRREVARRAPPRRRNAPSRPRPWRRPSPEPRVGPFGY